MDFFPLLKQTLANPNGPGRPPPTSGRRGRVKGGFGAALKWVKSGMVVRMGDRERELGDVALHKSPVGRTLDTGGRIQTDSESDKVDQTRGNETDLWIIHPLLSYRPDYVLYFICPLANYPKP